MKTFTTLSSIVLLASTLGFASTAMAAGTRAPTSSVNNPSISVAANSTGNVVPTITLSAPVGATAVSYVKTDGTQGTAACGLISSATTPSTVDCTYDETKHGVINNDKFFVKFTYTYGGKVYTAVSTVSVTIAPLAHS
jgi:hypothetical protein